MSRMRVTLIAAGAATLAACCCPCASKPRGLPEMEQPVIHIKRDAIMDAVAQLLLADIYPTTLGGTGGLGSPWVQCEESDHGMGDAWVRCQDAPRAVEVLRETIGFRGGIIGLEAGSQRRRALRTSPSCRGARWAQEGSASSVGAEMDQHLIAMPGTEVMDAVVILLLAGIKPTRVGGSHGVVHAWVRCEDTGRAIELLGGVPRLREHLTSVEEGARRARPLPR